MIAEGLLWFDDDPRRPFSAKLAEAAQRFSERTGWQPTVCEAHPDTLALQATPGRAGRGKSAKATPPQDTDIPRLTMTPNPGLRPNYLLVGVEVGKTPRRARPAKPTGATRAAKAPTTQAPKTAKAATPTTTAKAAKAPAQEPQREEPASPTKAARAAAPRASRRPSATRPATLSA